MVFFLATGNLVVFLVCVNFDAKSCEKKKGVSTPENISMKEKVFSVHLNLRKLEHHYRITSGRFHTYTFIYFLTHPHPPRVFLFYKPPTDSTDAHIHTSTWGGCAQPRRLEWDPLMICAPPALRYSLLAAMQVGGVVGGWVSLGRGALENQRSVWEEWGKWK